MTFATRKADVLQQSFGSDGDLLPHSRPLLFGCLSGIIIKLLALSKGRRRLRVFRLLFRQHERRGVGCAGDLKRLDGELSVDSIGRPVVLTGSTLP